MSPRDKPLVWLRGEIKTSPFSPEASIEAGFLLRRLQRGELLSLPASRPMPGIGALATNCESETVIKRGGSCITSPPTPSWCWRSSVRRLPRYRTRWRLIVGGGCRRTCG